jgi:hypothetical protein
MSGFRVRMNVENGSWDAVSRIDIGFPTNNVQPLLDFWQKDIGLPYEREDAHQAPQCSDPRIGDDDNKGANDSEERPADGHVLLQNGPCSVDPRLHEGNRR